MKTKSIKIGFNCSFKKPNYGNTIYSYRFEKEVEIEKHDDEEEVKKALWEEAVSEIENQIQLT